MADDKPNLTELLKKAKEMQQEMQAAQDALAKIEITGKAGTGENSVEITMTARYSGKRCKIGNAAMADKAILEDLIVAAINDTTRKIETTSRNKVMDLTKKMGLPTDLPEDADTE